MSVRDRKTLVFVRSVIDDVASTDVRISDYLTRFYRTAFVLGHFCGRSSLLQEARPVNVPVKRMKIPFLRWFTISLLLSLNLSKLGLTLSYDMGLFLSGRVVSKNHVPSYQGICRYKESPYFTEDELATAMYDALFVWTLKIAEVFC